MRQFIVNSSTLVILIILSVGCSGASSPILPQQSGREAPTLETTSIAELSSTDSTDHYLWLYELIYIDPSNPEDINYETIPVRSAGTHWNVLNWLEQAPCADCFKLLSITPSGNGTLLANIEITHPFANPNLTGFDVRGITMFNASHTFPVSGLTFSDREAGDGAVVNPDGFTALYNSTTAGQGPGGLQGYLQGKLATSTAPNALLNPYKRFNTHDAANTRNGFYAGDTEAVTYEIDLPDAPNPFVMGYAVDASWASPTVKPVTNPMSDFPPEANCPEPWKIVTGVTATSASLLNIDVYDWEGKATYHAPVVECPEMFDGALTANWSSDGTGYSRYFVEISNTKLAPAGNYFCLISVEANENDPVGKPWLDLTAYQVLTISVTEPGDLIWAKRAGGPVANGEDVGDGIVALSDNSMVVVGLFYGSAVFGQGEPNETVLVSTDESDLFSARYNSDGTLAWAKSASGGEIGGWTGITALSDNSFVVVGHFTGSATFGQGEANETVFDSAGNADIFIARYNSDGTLAWARRDGGTDKDWGFAVTALQDNSTVATGYFTGTVIFGEGEPNQSTLVSAGDYDIFVARYSPDGSLQWAKGAGGSSYDPGKAIAALPDNSTVVTGFFKLSATFGQGEPNETVLVSSGADALDFFVARYNPDGSLAWAKCAVGTDNEAGFAVTALTGMSFVVTGDFAGSATFGQGEPNETTLTSAGINDIFVAQYNPDGTLAWARHAGGEIYDSGYAITALSDNSTVVSGYFGGSVTFGEGEPNSTILTASAPWDLDIFIARYNPDGTLAWAKGAGGTEGDYGNSITALSDNSVAVTGTFRAPATFGPGEPNETLLDCSGYEDIFVARFAW